MSSYRTLVNGTYFVYTRNAVFRLQFGNSLWICIYSTEAGQGFTDRQRNFSHIPSWCSLLRSCGMSDLPQTSLSIPASTIVMKAMNQMMKWKIWRNELSRFKCIYIPHTALYWFGYSSPIDNTYFLLAFEFIFLPWWHDEVVRWTSYCKFPSLIVHRLRKAKANIEVIAWVMFEGCSKNTR